MKHNETDEEIKKDVKKVTEVLKEVSNNSSDTHNCDI